LMLDLITYNHAIITAFSVMQTPPFSKLQATGV